MSQDIDKYTCKECGKGYSFRHNLYRHMNSSHPDQLPSISKKYLKCPMCDFTPKSTVKLTEHLNENHKIKLEHEEIKFGSETDFLKWKVSVETSSLTNFIKVRGDKTVKDGSSVTYFKCHRSGVFVSKSNGIRRLKTQGSNKINGICPANIKYIKSKDGSSIKVIFQKTHAGHENDIGHLSLTNEEKQRLAMKIAAKVSLDVILDEVQNSFSDNNLGRIHLLTKQDLHNIEKRYNLSSYLDKTVQKSVDIWVEEMKQSENCCVLFYKAEGVVIPEYDQLNASDFLLIIMNEAQSEILQKYGNNYVSMDRTLELNAYKYELVTLMVLDDTQQGFPCAFLICNKIDEYTLTLFLTQLASKVGMLHPEAFMSDVEELFYSSWKNVMFTPEFRLYNSWHIDSAFRKNMCLIKGKEKQTEVYTLLRKLMEEPDVTTFQIIIEKALKQLYQEEETSEFVLYFTNTFANNPEPWAQCFRPNSSLDSGQTHLERVHRTIKYIYLQGRNVKCLDKTIHAIMQFVRDKLIDRFMMLNKGKMVNSLKEIRTRHRKALVMDKDQVQCDGKDWKVISALGKDIYTVQEACTECDCQLVCNDCNNICIHRFTCSCIDSAIKWNMCKHIHLVCQVKQLLQTSIMLETKNNSFEKHLVLPPCADEQGNIRVNVDSNLCSIGSDVSEKLVPFLSENCREQLQLQFRNLLGLIQTNDHVNLVKDSLLSMENMFKNDDTETANCSKIYFLDIK